MGIPALTQPKRTILPADSGYDSTDPSGEGGVDWTPGLPPILVASSGEFSQGATISITGSNFSSNRQTQLFYDDFSGGTLGAPLGNGWEHGVHGSYIYDDDGMRNGGRCAYILMQDGYQFDSGRLIPESQTIFCEHWIKYTMPVVSPEDGSGGPQLKLTRIGAGSALEDNSANPNFGATRLGSSGNSVAVSQALGEHTTATYITLPPDGEWHKLHQAVKLSSELGAPDGWRYIKTSTDDSADSSAWAGTEKHYASPTGVIPKSAWAGESMATRSNSDAYTRDGFFSKVLLPFFQRTYQVSHVRIANFWINDSAERVVVGAASTWDECAKTAVIQPCLSRSSAEWTFACEMGNLPASGPLYAYIVNADGVYNTTGILVRAA